ncbi:MAG: hypothetical protein ABW352_05195 [Polyangiales bacterium]
MRLEVRSLWLSCLFVTACEHPLTLTPIYRDAGPTARRVRDAAQELVEEQAPDEPIVEEPDASSLELIPLSLFGQAADPACDLNGYWAVKQVLINDAGIAGSQRTAQWFYVALSQQGEEVTMVEHHDCGQLTRGDTQVVVPVDTLRVLVSKNSWKGRSARIEREGDACAVRFERAWTVRGADPAEYLPAGVFASGGLSAQAAMPLPNVFDTEGAEDWNGATLSRLGFALSISGATSGTRWMTQRLYSEWFSDDAHAVPATVERDSLVLAARFDSEMNVLSASPSNGLLQTLVPTPDGSNVENHVELKFLGVTEDDPRGASVVDQSDRVKRCLHIQNTLLPY